MESEDKIPRDHIAHLAGYKTIKDISISRLEYLKRKDKNFKFKVIV